MCDVVVSAAAAAACVVLFVAGRPAARIDPSKLTGGCGGRLRGRAVRWLHGNLSPLSSLRWHFAWQLSMLEGRQQDKTLHCGWHGNTPCELLLPHKVSAEGDRFSCCKAGLMEARMQNGSTISGLLLSMVCTSSGPAHRHPSSSDGQHAAVAGRPCPAVWVLPSHRTGRGR